MSTENKLLRTVSSTVDEPFVSEALANDDLRSHISKREGSESLKKSDSNNGSEDVDEKSPYVNLPEALQHLTHDELKKLEKKAIRKIDIRLLPMLAFIYILNFLNRSNITSARLGGLEADLNLQGNQYQVCISILFVGYILFQIPGNMVLNKVGRPSIFVSVVVFSWGACATAMGGVQNYAGLAVTRVLLGVAESAFFGGALMILSLWYDKKSLASRNSLLYIGNPLSSAFNGLLAAGLLKMDGLGGIAGWRWLFILEGGITVLTVPFAYFILPDKPANTKFLSEMEKEIIQWKLRRDLGDVDDSDKEAKVSTWDGFKLAVKDMKMWMICGQVAFLAASKGITNFFPTIVATLNYSSTITLCLVAPPYLLVIPVSYFWARHADKTGERTFHIIIPLALLAVSYVLVVATTNFGARYFGMVLMMPTSAAGFVIAMTWMSNTCPRPPAKRAVALALMIGLCNSPFTWTPFLYPTGDGPRYVKAMVCNVAFSVLAILMVVLLRIRLMVLNKRIANGTMNWQKELGKGNDGSKIDADFRYLY
ncbi:Major Facilitator Superfamily protein [Candida parapsilosis]|uniref:MFS domain-containing protein n=2 Tax=Candida parapsilosis TaxID=5480 RepID=G8BC56_CANPC|nr:uncharacterized protein CPAR2_802710 [Candida parapsilosis]KAF6051620.1 Major Facilitator Superfamily protein [Candida parapsilosis]KAF6052883.1 Major Facilitator Superfamily protein [Candida parapsilosis]KAF6053422.1 Major Facilitator Superfamily protein [Candida parapsilosis]KAF6064661.1 Major Facilitator Superfamily protein [Candida parapsilosis]KAI5902935.1 putative transporter [Candida parapsilosis]